MLSSKCACVCVCTRIVDGCRPFMLGWVLLWKSYVFALSLTFFTLYLALSIARFQTHRRSILLCKHRNLFKITTERAKRAAGTVETLFQNYELNICVFPKNSRPLHLCGWNLFTFVLRFYFQVLLCISDARTYWSYCHEPRCNHTILLS